MDDKSTRILRSVYGEILRQYSPSKSFFIRHYNYELISRVDIFYDDYYSKMVAKGMPTEKDKLDYLNKTKRWTDKDEKKLKDSLVVLNSLEENKKTLYLESQIRQVNDSIKAAKKEYFFLLNKKLTLLDSTAETATTKEIDALYVFNSIFKDEKLTIPLFTRPQWEELDSEEFESISEEYNRALSKFKVETIQKIALSGWYQGIYNLSDGKAFELWGTNVANLTFYQEQLTRYAGFFKNVLEDDIKIPDDIKEEPTRLIEWWRSGKKLREVYNEAQSKSKNAMIAGATSEDLAKIGQQAQKSSFKELAEKQGKKTLNMSDMIKAGMV